jgi:hypothetical protein
VPRFLKTAILAAIIVGGGWALYHRDQIHSIDDAWRLLSSQIQPATESVNGGLQPLRPTAGTLGILASWSAPAASADTLRVASFNVHALDATRLGNPDNMALLARIVSSFDVIALQDLHCDPANLQQFVRFVNDGGFRFAYAISPPSVNEEGARELSAFLFNQDKVWLDDSFTYTVYDPEQILDREPFVGWFRAAGPRPDRAFTFTLVNVHFNKRRAQEEIRYLPQLFRAVRKDGRGEDDVMILGDFESGNLDLGTAGQGSHLTWAVQNRPTNTLGTQPLDNLVYDIHATTEFTGATGVFDFLRQFNMSIEQATNVSDHLPIWAEFSVIEGGMSETSQPFRQAGFPRERN